MNSLRKKLRKLDCTYFFQYTPIDKENVSFFIFFICFFIYLCFVLDIEFITKYNFIMIMLKKQICVAALVAAVICMLGIGACKKTENNARTSDNALAFAKAIDSTNLGQFEFLRMYTISDDGNGSGMVFLEDGSLANSENGHIESVSTLKGKHETLTDSKRLAKHFPDFVKRVHETNDYLITCFETFYLDNAEVFRVEYVINHDFGNPESALYVTRFGESKEPPTIIVKCMGSCIKPTEDCVEVYNFVTNEARCSCQSDNCSMQIEYVK